MSVAILWPVVVAGLLLSGLAGFASSALQRRHRHARVAMGLLIALAGLRVSVGTEQVPVRQLAVDVVLAVDTTTSMSANDHRGKARLDGVRADVRRLITQLPGARFAMVTFDNEARVAVPATHDLEAVRAQAETMGWREFGLGRGSDVSVGVPVLADLLKGLREADPGRARYLVYFGDGENTSEEPVASFESVGRLVDGALVLGYGTVEGATMRERFGAREQFEVAGRPAISRMDPDTLEAVATQLGGSFRHRVSDSPVPLHVERGRAATTPTGAVAERELTIVPGGLLVLLVLAELGWLMAGYRRTRRAMR